MIYVGIDPGVSGGIAGARRSGECAFAYRWCKAGEPDVDGAIVEVMRRVCHDWDIAACAIERVWSSPQMGPVSAFTFGGAYHVARALAIQAQWLMVEPTPQQWQDAMACRTGGDKSITKRAAQYMCPDRRVINATADAIILAAYCRRVFLGEIQGPGHGKEGPRKKGRRKASV
ncbi:MAG TPA: hypothetical protein PKZ07_16185 [Sedimentisphaerales bacterium]|nr:hypothetical protein [Sedimentisphaerales bacterium]